MTIENFNILRMLNNAGFETMKMDGDSSIFTVGRPLYPGEIQIFGPPITGGSGTEGIGVEPENNPRILINSGPGGSGSILINNPDNSQGILLRTSEDPPGVATRASSNISLYSPTSSITLRSQLRQRFYVNGERSEAAFYNLNGRTIFIRGIIGHIEAGGAKTSGSLKINDPNGNISARIYSQSASGEIYLRNPHGETFKVQGNTGRVNAGGATGAAGRLNLKDTKGITKATIYSGDTSGQIILKNSEGTTFQVAGHAGGVTIGGSKTNGIVNIRDDNTQSRVVLWTKELAGYAAFSNRSGATIVADGGIGGLFAGGADTNGFIQASNTTGKGRALMWINGENDSGQIWLFDHSENPRIAMSANTGNAYFKDEFGNDKIVLRTTGGKGADIELAGGADCAEEFDVSNNSSEMLEAGTVMSIGDNEQLTPSNKPYDKRVAGVISGSSKYRSGIILDKQGHASNGNRIPIALIGKVLCKLDTSYGEIEVGDLLTTSNTRGHAMKASDPTKSFGCIIGKALKSLRSGIDMVPILVALQ